MSAEVCPQKSDASQDEEKNSYFLPFDDFQNLSSGGIIHYTMRCIVKKKPGSTSAVEWSVSKFAVEVLRYNLSSCRIHTTYHTVLCRFVCHAFGMLRVRKFALMICSYSIE